MLCIPTGGMRKQALGEVKHVPRLTPLGRGSPRIQYGCPRSVAFHTNKTRKGQEGDRQASGRVSEESLSKKVAFKLRSKQQGRDSRADLGRVPHASIGGLILKATSSPWPPARPAWDTISPQASSEQPHLCPVPEQVGMGRKGLCFGIKPTNLALNQASLLSGT